MQDDITKTVNWWVPSQPMWLHPNGSWFDCEMSVRAQTRQATGSRRPSGLNHNIFIMLHLSVRLLTRLVKIDIKTVTRTKLAWTPSSRRALISNTMHCHYAVKQPSPASAAWGVNRFKAKHVRQTVALHINSTHVSKLQKTFRFCQQLSLLLA